MTASGDGRVAAALAAARADTDEDRRWKLVVEASRAGDSAEVLSEVLRLLGSADPEDQRLGADLAGEMQPDFDEDGTMRAWIAARGWPPLPDPTPFAPEDREQAAHALRTSLRSTRDPDVVCAAIVAVGKLGLDALVPDVIAHAGSDDADVRECIGSALHGMTGPEPEAAIATLVALAGDPVDEVRSWALFALAGSGPDGAPVDTPAAVAAYRANLGDPEDEVRMEAERALALLGDVEQLAVVFDQHALVPREAVELAIELADPRLHAPLVCEREALEEEDVRDGDYAVLLDRAIAACRPPTA